jgi:two-component system NtrC family sensor kinase
MSQKFLKHVETIREQAARCERITQGLLNFARRTEIRATEVNVANLVKEAVALLQNRAMTEGKRIETDVPADLPALQADPHHLGQVFLNLVNNALDAVDKNGKVAIRVRVENNSIVVDVADNGTGIAEEDLKEIFAPFFTTKPIGKGTGLGLSICFGIVERMNGSISVKSKLGGGTTFTVRLPVERRKSTET